MKKSLLETNPYLKDPELRRKMLDRSIISSSDIEGIHITEDDLQRWREERANKEVEQQVPENQRDEID